MLRYNHPRGKHSSESDYMDVILNSDILRDERLITDDVSKRLRTFLQACAERNYVIVVPLTALLEFNRQQSELVPKTAAEVDRAYELLDRFKIPYSRVDPSEVVKPPNLVSLIQKHKAKIVIEEPTLQDFQEAHRRACLHESPISTAKQSDEMRDLIIWVIALRLAKQNGGALLVSRDDVHNNPLGRGEAEKIGLVCVRSVEDAEWYLDVDIGTPASRLVEQLLTPIWGELLSKGLPLTDEVFPIGVSRASFDQGDHGLSSVICSIKVKTRDKKTLKADTEIHINGNVLDEVKLSDIKVDNEDWQDGFLLIRPSKVWSDEADDYENRLDALLQIMEE